MLISKMLISKRIMAIFVSELVYYLGNKFSDTFYKAYLSFKIAMNFKKKKRLFYFKKSSK